MEKEEITTNDYLKGIVLNLPDSRHLPIPKLRGPLSTLEKQKT